MKSTEGLILFGATMENAKGEKIHLVVSKHEDPVRIQIAFAEGDAKPTGARLTIEQAVDLATSILATSRRNAPEPSDGQTPEAA